MCVFLWGDRMKQKFPAAFQDLCLYSEVCLLLNNYSFRLTSRRFVQELFQDLNFDEASRFRLPCLYPVAQLVLKWSLHDRRWLGYEMERVLKLCRPWCFSRSKVSDQKWKRRLGLIFGNTMCYMVLWICWLGSTCVWTPHRWLFRISVLCFAYCYHS